MALLPLQGSRADRRRSTRNEYPGPAALCTRVMRFINLLQPLLDDMGINLCGRNIRVAQHELDGTQVRAALEQMSGKTVPQHVWSKRHAQPVNPPTPLQYLPHA